jgi:hypothetical protein
MKNTEKLNRSAAPNLLVQFLFAEFALQLPLQGTAGQFPTLHTEPQPSQESSPEPASSMPVRSCEDRSSIDKTRGKNSQKKW